MVAVKCVSCGAELPEGAMFCGNCGRAVAAITVPRDRMADPRPGDTTILAPNWRSGGTASIPVTESIAPPAAAAASHRVGAGEVASDAEAQTPTRPVPPVPYMLAFSTGERVVVVGAGLLGRRPFAQPNERFDQLVSIADQQRSVSKTHLEFGIENGELWICDRYSANGTVIIPPSGGPHRCEPGRRYRVSRGGRIEIGDHWFDVR